MTKKQIKKHASNILKWESIHEDPNSTEEEKRKAESNIFQLSNMIMCMPNGLTIMAEIDDFIRHQTENQNT